MILCFGEHVKPSVSVTVFNMSQVRHQWRFIKSDTRVSYAGLTVEEKITDIYACFYIAPSESTSNVVGQIGTNTYML